jgi:hypothetical protein
MVAAVRRVVLGCWEVALAVVTLSAVEVLLRTRDLPAICRVLGIGYDPADPHPAGDRARLPRRARRALRAASLVTPRWPGSDTCLRRCLLLGHRLRALDPALRIGVRRDPHGGLAVHSWLEFDGRSLDPTAHRYAPLGALGSE